MYKGQAIAIGHDMEVKMKKYIKKFLSIVSVSVLIFQPANVMSAKAEKTFSVSPERCYQLAELIMDTSEIGGTVCKLNGDEETAEKFETANSIIGMASLAVEAIPPSAGFQLPALACASVIAGSVAVTFLENLPPAYTLTINAIESSYEPVRRFVTFTENYTMLSNYESSKFVFNDNAEITVKGTISAGLDMTKIMYSIDNVKGIIYMKKTMTTITNVNRIIYVKMPEPEIFSNEIDESSCNWEFYNDSIFVNQSPEEFQEIRNEIKQEKINSLRSSFWDNVRIENEKAITTLLTGIDATSIYKIEFVLPISSTEYFKACIEA